MGASIEQLDKGCKGWSGRHFVKKQTSRKARRLAKALMEDAPKRITKGWVS